MLFRRYYRTISALSKKAMMTNTQINTVNTGLSKSRRQSSVSLNVETTLKASHGLNAKMQTASILFQI